MRAETREQWRARVAAGLRVRWRVINVNYLLLPASQRQRLWPAVPTRASPVGLHPLLAIEYVQRRGLPPGRLPLGIDQGPS